MEFLRRERGDRAAYTGSLLPLGTGENGSRLSPAAGAFWGVNKSYTCHRGNRGMYRGNTPMDRGMPK